MIHWTTDYDAYGFHKAKCGVRVTTKEVESQKFEGVFRFYNVAFNTINSRKQSCPEKYCKECWVKATEQARNEFKLKK